MVKAHTPINWENEPSYNTPINEENLNKMDKTIGVLDDRIIEQETSKLDKSIAYTMVKDISFNENNGIFTVTRLNGSTFTIDTRLEKIAINFKYDYSTQKLIVTLIDGTTQSIDMSALLTQYEFTDSATLDFSTDSSGKVTATIKSGSITEDMLQPNYLATIKVEVAKAQASATAAATSEANALASENAAKISETNAKISETNAKSSETSAKTSETNAKASETSAANSATSASTSAKNASASATTATNKASEAANSATSASESADTATNKASEASTSATNANTYATKSQSYAVGGTASRPNEDIDNARYYYEQAKSISESFSGALVPMGTVSFEDLPSLEDAVSGWMYNISNEFVTTDEFKEGAGYTVPLGANVFKTFDGFWDVLAGSPVTGIKGSSETSYRRGNVNITPENVGALAVDGDSKSNTVTFTSNDVADGSATSWTSVTALASGITHATFFQRASQMFKNVRYLYKMLGTTDISSVGNGTVTGAISTLNSNLATTKSNLVRSDVLGFINTHHNGTGNMPLNGNINDYNEIQIITGTSINNNVVGGGQVIYRKDIFTKTSRIIAYGNEFLYDWRYSADNYVFATFGIIDNQIVISEFNNTDNTRGFYVAIVGLY